MKPTYFDLTVADLAAARRFFERVLGWRFERFPMPYEYYRIRAGDAREPGIDGGIGALKDAPLAAGRPMTVITMPSADLDAVLARVEECGGRIVEPKLAIPGIGWCATCAEPGGLLFGVIQAGRGPRALPARARKSRSRAPGPAGRGGRARRVLIQRKARQPLKR